MDVQANSRDGYDNDTLSVSEGSGVKYRLTALRKLSRFAGICALVAGVAVGLGEALLAQFVCVDECPSASDIFPWYFSSALRLIAPTAALLVLAYVAYVGYCLATAQSRRALAPTLVLLLGAAASVSAIAGYSKLYLTTMPLDHGRLIDGPAQSWTAGLGFTVAGLAFVWASIFYSLLLSPDEKHHQMPPSATHSEE